MGYTGPAVSPCVKWTLFFFNILVLLLGIGALFIGLYSRFTTNNWKDLADLSSDPAIILIVAGCICTVLGACGVVGALRENVCLLKIYYFGILLIILLEVVAGILAFFFQEQLREQAADKMLDGIRRYRTTNEPSNLDDAIEGIQEGLCCCGARTPRDWINNNIYHNCTRDTFRRILSACGVPPSCCRNSSQSQTNSQCGYIVYPYDGMPQMEQDAWPSIADRDNRIFTQGCDDALYRWLVGNYAVLGGVAAGILILQLITLFMAISLKDSIVNIQAQYAAEASRKGYI